MSTTTDPAKKSGPLILGLAWVPRLGWSSMLPIAPPPAARPASWFLMRTATAQKNDNGIRSDLLTAQAGRGPSRSAVAHPRERAAGWGPGRAGRGPSGYGTAGKAGSRAVRWTEARDRYPAS